MPVAFKADTNEVLMRLLRVSENLGPIRRYFLIVSTVERARLLNGPARINWHTEVSVQLSNLNGTTNDFIQEAYR